MSVLGDIVEHKRLEIAALRQQSWTPAVATARDVAAALRRRDDEPLRLICEHKRKSPSAGALSTTLSVADRCVHYAQSGATMISVLCDARFFDGAYEHLRVARTALDAAGLHTPLLAKEFVLDPVQLSCAKAHGADAMLLIARITPGAQLGELVDAALEVGLTPIVEVVSEDELAQALATRAQVLGVNARDLDTLKMDSARAQRLVSAIPKDRVACHFSGLKTAGDVHTVAETRADAALLGEALMRTEDPRPLLIAMRAAARTNRADAL